MTHSVSEEAADNMVYLARAIIAEAQPGSPIFTMHRHYPTGPDAFAQGFFTCWGWISAVSCAIGLITAIEWVLS